MKTDPVYQRLVTALEQITDCYCTCTGYYKCNGCETKAVHIAEAALDAYEKALASPPPDEPTPLSLSIERDPLAVSTLLDDSQREREMYHQLVGDIRKALGDDGLHAQLLDLPKLIAAKVAPPDEPEAHPREDDWQRGRVVTNEEARESVRAEQARASAPPPTGWQPISTAPRDGTHIDLWAKMWAPAFDEFVFQRFPDCVWMSGDSMCNRKPYWLNLSDYWCATHWMPLPAPPVSGEARTAPDPAEARRRPEPGTDGDMRQEIEDLRCLLNTRPILSKFHGLRGFELEKFIEAYSKWTDAVIEFTR